ncbi:MAG: hypothetical protein FJ088_07580, partial [Deltaproteobacteria bacterium]|nr:hypothetical protein [Deltaproteobacteria bacterium]
GEKIDTYLDPGSEETGKKDKRWFGEMAVFLLQSASAGVPLTSGEARLIHEYYGKAADAYKVWERWDLWDESVPDGIYNHGTGYRPSDEGHFVNIEDIAFLLEYCFSPFKNTDGVKFVDCDVVKDPGKWGTVIVK